MAGTEIRHRRELVQLRVTTAERDTLAAAAARAGLSLGGYARSVLLSAPPLRQSRRPPVERAQLARLLGEIGKLGSNVNQLARDWNSGNDIEPAAVATAATAILDMRAAVMAALGRAS